MLGAGRVNFSINLVIKPKFFRLKQNPVNELGESHNSKLTLFFLCSFLIPLKISENLTFLTP